MPFATVNGIRLAYERSGAGKPVVLIMGTGGGGSAWTMHQVPALNRAGYEAITFDNRGIPPSDVPGGKYALADLAGDVTGLIEALGVGPCSLVGTSLGAMVASEIAATRPELVTCCVLMAMRGRSDATRRALSAADRAMTAASVEPPREYEAVAAALQMLSPATLNNDTAAAGWLDIFMYSSGRKVSSGQADIDFTADRHAVLRTIKAPCRVIAFTDDLICPPHLCAEASEAIPDCDFTEIAACGHLGYLERPEETNRAIIDFLDKY